MSEPAYMKERVEQGNAGNREALCRLYGEAAVWLKAGQPMPQSLADWLAANLEELSQVIYQLREGRDTTRQIQPKVAQAMKVQRKGKSGALPSPVSGRKESAYAGDVAHFMEFDGLNSESAIGFVARMRGVSESQVKAAWNRYKDKSKS
jgi:hypothetical protein